MNEKSEIVMKAQRRKKIFAVEQFGGKCQICGYNKCINALEFHHIDKKTKEESPSYIIMRWSWEKARKELEKCILVCSNCHQEIHYKTIDISLQNFVMPWVEVECKTCKNKFFTKQENQLFCSNSCRGFLDRKLKWPTKEELKKLIDDGVSWTKISKIFGVCETSVRKWAKKYNLSKASGTRAAE